MRLVVVLAAATMTLGATLPAFASRADPETVQECIQREKERREYYYDVAKCVADGGGGASIESIIFNYLREERWKCEERVCKKKWSRYCLGSPGLNFRPRKAGQSFLPEPTSDGEERRRTPDRKKGAVTPAGGEPAPRGPLKKPCGTRANPCKPAAAAGGSSNSAMDRLGGSQGGGGVLRALGGGQGGGAAAKPAGGGGASSAAPAGGVAAPNIGSNAISRPGVSLPAQGQSPGLR
jgi:hypothetical protein